MTSEKTADHKPRRGRPRRLTVLVILCVLTLAACGGDDDSSGDEAAVVDAVSAFNQSLDDTDGASGCPLLSEEAQDAIDHFTGEASCEEAIEGYDVGGTEYGDREVRVVKLEGETATAESVTKDGPIDVPLEKIDGSWKIVDPPL